MIQSLELIFFEKQCKVYTYSALYIEHHIVGRLPLGKEIARSHQVDLQIHYIHLAT